MIFIRKIRKLIYNILVYYNNQKNLKYFYYCINCNVYNNEFECLANEKKIGLYSNLNEIEIMINFKLLEMLYERNYKFIIDTYNKFIFEININFSDSLDNIDFWLSLLKKFYENNKVIIIKYEEIPISLKNYKTRKLVKFYTIKEIQDKFFL